MQHTHFTSSIVIGLLCTLTGICAVSGWTDTVAQIPPPPLSLWTVRAVGCPDGGDDLGPPVEIQLQRFRESRSTLGACDVSWGRAQPEDPGDDPPVYRFPEKQAFEWFLDGEGYYNMCFVDLWNPWAEKIKTEDPERYYQLAHEFVKAAVKHFNENLGVFLFFIGPNEPNLMEATDRMQRAVEPLKIVYPAMKEVDERNMLVGGHLSAGTEGILEEFYQAMEGNSYFDILDMHCYSHHFRTGVSIEQVITTRRVMERYGDHDKYIYLGEGYGPARALWEVVRTDKDEPVSDEEVEVIWQYVSNGYRNIVTEKPGYNPEWVLGATFFTLNDNIGGAMWRPRATPIANDQGELIGYSLDGYRLGPEESIDPRFYNGGMIDYHGNPKGDIIFNYPPELPSFELRGWLEREDEDPSAIPEWQRSAQLSVTGEIETLVLRLANPGTDAIEISGVRLSLKDQEVVAMRITPNIQDLVRGPEGIGVLIEPIGNVFEGTLRPGQTVVQKYQVVFPSELIGQETVVLGELDLVWNDRSFYWDCWIPVNVRPVIETQFASTRLVLTEDQPQVQAALTVVNRSTETITWDVALLADTLAELAMDGPTQALPGASVETAVKIRLPKDLPPGRETIPVEIAGQQHRIFADKVWGIPHTEVPPVLDGNLDEWRPQAGVEFRYPANAPSHIKLPDGPEDLSGKAYAMWDDYALYLAFEVQDNVFHQPYQNYEIWRGDSVQVAIDGLFDGVPGSEKRGGDDYEFGFAKTSDGNIVVRFYGPQRGGLGITEAIKLSVNRVNKKTIYEIAIPWTEIPPLVPHADRIFGMSFLINDSDGGQRGYIEWGSGIGERKIPGDYLPVRLVK